MSNSLSSAAPSNGISNSRHTPKYNVSVADLERLVGMEFLRATELAALAAHSWMGKGNKEAGDEAASEAIRGHFSTVNISGLVTIGEGIKDDAPGIFKGEKLGVWSPGSLKMAIALDPIDGTTIVAKGLNGAVSVIAAATCADESEDPMSMLADIPSFYMQKIAVGPKVATGPVQVRLDNSVKENLEIVALKLGKRVQDVTVSILDRPRHGELIQEVRSTGATIRLISDGDIAGAIAPSLPDAGVDIYMGTGGSPEAVLAAAAVKCLGGEIFARMWPRDEAERADLKKRNVTDKDLAKIWKSEDLARGEGTLFAATGISDSPLLRGVRFSGHHASTHSILMRGQYRTVRYVRTIHDMDHKRFPSPAKRK
ncbi:MAG: class II fructose-bisphosphatase [Tepidisphaeraceae bacterium]